MKDGIHGMLPREQMCAGAKKYWDFYNMKPGAGFYQEEFGFYSLEKWQREDGLAKDADLDEVFGFDRALYGRQQSWEFRNNTSDRNKRVY